MKKELTDAIHSNEHYDIKRFKINSLNISNRIDEQRSRRKCETKSIKTYKKTNLKTSLNNLEK